MDDAALVAVELRGPRRRAVRHADEFLVAIDGVGHAGALIIGEEEEAAVREGFRRIAARHEHGGAEHLGVARQAEGDRRDAFRRKRRSRLLPRDGLGDTQQDKGSKPLRHDASVVTVTKPRNHETRKHETTKARNHESTKPRKHETTQARNHTYVAFSRFRGWWPA